MTNQNLSDLDMGSILDVVEENFKRVGLKTYAVRMVYAGEHTANPKEDLIKQFRHTIDVVNGGYCDIAVSGLLLVYDSYFVHIIEGSEDTIHRQLRLLFNREIEWIELQKKLDIEKAAAYAAAKAYAEEEQMPLEMEEPLIHERPLFKRMKILMVYHSISTLFFSSGWRAVTSRPPSLVGTMNIHGPLNEHMEQLKICLDKIRRLCDMAFKDKNLTFEGLSPVDPKMNVLPEVTLLDFLLDSPHVYDLRKTMHLHRRVDDYVFYFEKVWPLATHYTPRLLYKLKIDDSFVEPLPVMPWELVKKEATEDENKEERDSQSSSD